MKFNTSFVTLRFVVKLCEAVRPRIQSTPASIRQNQISESIHFGRGRKSHLILLEIALLCISTLETSSIVVRVSHPHPHGTC